MIEKVHYLIVSLLKTRLDWFHLVKTEVSEFLTLVDSDFVHFWMDTRPKYETPSEM